MADMMKPIIAHRVWILNTKTNLLRSYVDSEIWSPGMPLESRELPKVFNTSGIHAWKSKSRLLQYILTRQTNNDEVLIEGTVALWGNIIECERGYRAQYAYPYKLEVLSSKKKINRKKIENTLRNNYGCEVENLKFTGMKTYFEGTKIWLKNGKYYKKNDKVVKYRNQDKVYGPFQKHELKKINLLDAPIDDKIDEFDIFSIVSLAQPVSLSLGDVLNLTYTLGSSTLSSGRDSITVSKIGFIK